VYFTGGEPMLNPDHWKILESIPDPTQVSLRYNSNLTVLSYKDKHVFDYWKKFRSIFFQISLEGYKEINNLIRIGSDWDRIEKNLNELIDFKNKFNNIELGIFSCINVLTVWDIEKLIDYVIDKDLTFNMIIEMTGGWLSLNVIPINKRAILQKKLETIYSKLRNKDINVKNRINLAIQELETLGVSDRLPDTIANIQSIDSMYNINLFEKIKDNLL
jgi:sulfatase maturation enzyme AslB (radical SAM superfamily)